jgi:hypothetical protein
MFLCEAFEEYAIPLVFICDIRGEYHDTCLSKNSEAYSINHVLVVEHRCVIADENKGYGILLECLTQKQGLWYTPRMSQTKTRGIVYSGNVSDKRCVYHNPRFFVYYHF